MAVAAGVGSGTQWLAENDLGWAGLLLPAALSRIDGEDALRERALKAILDSKGEQILEVVDVLEQDGTLRGWSWYPNTFSWVEPTSYALLSLHAARRDDDPRVAMGQALLRDRQCGDGGWNYGNPRVMDKHLESYLPPTGWACMAMPRGPEVDRGLARLLDARTQPSPLTLSMAILARGAHGEPIDDLPSLLGRLQDADGGFDGRADWTALAACALRLAEEGVHVFGR